MAKSTLRYTVLLLTVFCLLLAGGCGDGRRPSYPAGGTVALTDGTPLAGGWVEFELIGDKSVPTARARVQPDGSFQLGTYKDDDGALEGEHRVLVLPPSVPRKRGAEPMLRQEGTPNDTPPVAIDHRYGRFDTSGLTFTVTRDASKNRFQIRLDRR